MRTTLTAVNTELELVTIENERTLLVAVCWLYALRAKSIRVVDYSRFRRVSGEEWRSPSRTRAKVLGPAIPRQHEGTRHAAHRPPRTDLREVPEWGRRHDVR